MNRMDVRRFAWICLTLVSSVYSSPAAVRSGSPLRVELDFSPKFRRIATEFNCEKSGFFNHATDCRKFIRCAGYSPESTILTAFEFECSERTIWDNGIESCIFGACRSVASSSGISDAAETSSTAGTSGGDSTGAGTASVDATDATATDVASPGTSADSNIAIAFENQQPDVAIVPGGPQTQQTSSTGGEMQSHTSNEAATSDVTQSGQSSGCQASGPIYKVSEEYCNLFYRCDKPNEKYVCNALSAFDETRQMCREIHPEHELCTGKKLYAKGDPLRGDLVGNTALIPLLKSPIYNSEPYKLVDFNTKSPYGLQGIEGWVLPLDKKDPSYKPLRVELTAEKDQSSDSNLPTDEALFPALEKVPSPDPINKADQLPSIDEGVLDKLLKVNLQKLKDEYSQNRVPVRPALSNSQNTPSNLETMITSLQLQKPTPLTPVNFLLQGSPYQLPVTLSQQTPSVNFAQQQFPLYTTNPSNLIRTQLDTNSFYYPFFNIQPQLQQDLSFQTALRQPLFGQTAINFPNLGNALNLQDLFSGQFSSLQLGTPAHNSGGQSSTELGISNFPISVAFPFNIPSLGNNFPTLGTNFPTLEANFPTLGTKFPTLDANFPTLDTTFSKLRTKLPTLDTRQKQKPQPIQLTPEQSTRNGGYLFYPFLNPQTGQLQYSVHQL